MLSDRIAGFIRRILTGSGQDFTFKGYEQPLVEPLDKVDLYIHIPFCKNLCPYCPYNKIPYEERLVKPYTEAVLSEISLYRKIIGNPEITSIYVGGGTPTTMTDELGIIIEKIRQDFNVTGDIGVETNPSDIDTSTVKKLKSFGVDLLSIGVQSFNDKFLDLIGRNYRSYQAYKAIDTAAAASFKTVNIDLMFNLPHQAGADILFDLQESVRLGVDQVTAYPLFTFPYSSVGKFLKLKRVRMPGLLHRRKAYRLIHNFMLDNNYERVSVWGFKKGGSAPFSSVTRTSYIGLGAGGASSLPASFYFNTFSVAEYMRTASDGILPTALHMNLTQNLRKYYDFYWKLYQTRIDKKQFKDYFRGDNNIKLFVNLAKIFRMLRIDNEKIELTERGAFYIHLLQNYFVLNYIDKVWSAAMKQAWPEQIKI
jgi:oxygen-independent coproporphyrinogen III oxidase